LVEGNSVRLVFAGTSSFAVPILRTIVDEGYVVTGVVTQPDRPAGRGQTLQPPPVKTKALELGLPVYQPVTLRNDEARSLFATLAPELLVVVAYGKLLPAWLLSLPRFGAVNLHGSLLPRYRGAAPIQWAVANGETKTGVTTMQMDPGMDTGPILLTLETVIGAEETAVALAERMSKPGAQLMLQTLAGLEAGSVTPIPQDNSLATKAPLLKKEHGLIDWSLTAHQIFNRLRGFTPWPGIYTGFRGKKLQIWQAQPHAIPDSGNAPGALLISRERLSVVCGGGTLLELLELQLEGRRRMSASDFVNGSQPKNGERLEKI